MKRDTVRFYWIGCLAVSVALLLLVLGVYAIGRGGEDCESPCEQYTLIPPAGDLSILTAVSASATAFHATATAESATGQD